MAQPQKKNKTKAPAKAANTEGECGTDHTTVAPPKEKSAKKRQREEFIANKISQTRAAATAAAAANGGVRPNGDNKNSKSGSNDDDDSAPPSRKGTIKDHSTTMFGSEVIRRGYDGPKCVNHQKCLAFGSRNMSHKERHMLNDLKDMSPHFREHAKVPIDIGIGDTVQELCTLHQCNSTIFVESHRRDVTNLWMSQAPSGPSVKFQVDNINTADQLRMVGNCLKFSRPLLHFDKEFETHPHLRVTRSLLQTIFNVPQYHPRSKPFVDHILCFYYLDEHIWFRNYQIVPAAGSSGGGKRLESAPPTLMEIGPRFTLYPLAIFNGCCKGSVLWKNPNAQAPTEVRRSRKERQLAKYQENQHVQVVAEKHRKIIGAVPEDPLGSIFK